MATHVLDSGPLTEYFRDELENNQNSSQSLEGELGVLEPVSEDTEEQNPGRSLHKSHSNLTLKINDSMLSPSPIPGLFPIPESAPDSFAEQFKYLICSSGLLEKDYVLGVSGGVSEADAGLEKSELWIKARQVVEVAKERLDLMAAGACLVVGLTVVLGVWVFAAILLLGGLAAVGYERYGNGSGSISAPLTSSPSSTPKAQALASLTTFLTRSHTLNSTLAASLGILQSEPNSRTSHQELRVTLHRLTDNMTDHIATATSSLLEMADKSELAVLGEMYDIPVVGSFFYSRRRGQEISSSEDEFREQSVPSPRRYSSLRPLSTPSPRRTAIPQFSSQSFPRRHTNNLSIMSLPADPNDRFTQIPERTPRLPKRASYDRLSSRRSWGSQSAAMMYERRISEDGTGGEEGDGSFGSGESSEEGDRTMLRAFKGGRSPDSSTSPEMEGFRSPTMPVTPLSKLRPAASPFRHIPSPLSRKPAHLGEGGMKPLRTAPLATQTGSSSLLPSPFEADIFPTSASASASPRPTEPFTRAFQDETDPGKKRRSLQNMPYISSDDDRPGADLTRTRSMPISDLQALREARAVVGDSSRRSSLNPSNAGSASTGLGLGLPSTYPPDRRSSLISVPSPLTRASIQRHNSVSPLTTPALTASALGIHLKRRRMACCLLGLRFVETEGRYWEEVRDELDELVRRMNEERENVQEVLRKVMKELAVRETLDDLVLGQAQGAAQMGQSPVGSSFPIASTFLDSQRDFAPRTSNEQKLGESVEKMMESMVRAWGELASIKKDISEQDGEGQKMERWLKVRERLGDAVREWERGKEVISDMSQKSKDGEEDDLREADHPADLPEFTRSWDTSQTSRSVSLETDRQSFNDKVRLAEYPSNSPSPDGLEPLLEDLPPAGIDTVFEDISAPALSKSKALLNTMSREERIALVKQARERGVKVEDLLGVGHGQGEKVGEDVRMRGGEIVNELEGVIDAIRRMKQPATDRSTEREGEKEVEEISRSSARAPSRPLPPPPQSTPSSPSHPSNPSLPSSHSHLEFDLAELRKSFRAPMLEAKVGREDHVLG
ncbi:hypothetical protein L198_02098 [Cryptococcus wingfieldii CBS 7118]|uniref:Uncharacterized protein n=1 Tax=Cryptococcus wingfieldii CBS 7118 TaxID=1295528 RepID=A0A1E3JX36_9TREE|nr:hypothetical protein L198_02098 [Cryptococcus wingfieldii CBS 7118]ODO05405.1 hypothetical protein L198_02098 [Cryptococcus wingfieldii CBS 7118]